MFNKSNFCHIASNNRNEQKGSVFIYKTADTLAQVTQSGYFNEKLIDINLHDLIIHVQYNPVDRTLKKSVLIVTERTLDNVETAPILDQTIGDDIADLGDQVQGIEEKIPGNASSTNQLATQNDITNKITNCIIEIPQDIQLELNNGAITLKANSKLYQPNGSGVFTPIVIGADKVRSDFTSFGSGTYMLFYSQSYGGLIAANINNCVSGATDTSTATSHTWYDTTNNKIKTYENGSYTRDDLTLPLGVFENTYGTGVTSIKYVFNGFGDIGISIYVLPGVKGLVPNGRNADGTLKNTLSTTTAVSVYTPSSVVNDYEYQLAYNGSLTPFYSHMTYNSEENINYTTSGTPSAWAIVGSLKFNNNTISEFNPKTTFHAADYNDTGFIAYQSMPSDNYLDLSLPDHGAYITVPADGYLVMSIEPGVSGQGIGLRNATAGDIGQIIYMGGTGRYIIHTHVSKGDSVQVFHYNSTPNMFRLVYANGSK